MDEGQYGVPPSDRAVLLAAIGRVAGLGHPFRERPPPRRWWGSEDDLTPEPPGRAAVEVLGGVVDRADDRVAWVERYTFRPDGDDGWEVVLLNLAGEGTWDLPLIEGWAHRGPGPRVSVHLVPDRADKVCEVRFVRFVRASALDESLVVVYDWAGEHKRLCRHQRWPLGTSTSASR
jgi:hypothetical protein